ncbi:bifunctional metallophosphatase/5'-nucleotidase [Paenibacillus sp. sptzw28]|uniref:bifunctional metallophosphatase/5'-nucleotidase n=1 Tax=Paenibacillus sp. sptzw28 TaxID=715179 RepID=UPI001C6E64D4|nr:bifunctional metallophosphatase/5'-nucleotidase [Paenibacillus sp. sptzw28]QYR23970.1 bifunctional metallophosphatase/5'-nucleotidase [Paenibacillus sp. sptzw28]
MKRAEKCRTGDDDRLRTETITLLVTSDIHGHIHPTDYRNEGERNLGLAKLSTVIERERRRDPSLLLVDNGDLLQGTPLTYHYAKYDRTGVHPMVAALNHLRYDAAVIGNHEFNYGAEVLRRAVRDSEFPWLSANITDVDSGEPAFGKPYLIKEIDNKIKVAILGLTTHYIPNWEHPVHIKEFKFHDALEAAKVWVSYIRRTENPDVMVVSYHGGFERDLETGEATEALTGENQGYALCTAMEGIDVLLTGHQHRALTGEVNGIAVLQPNFNGQAIGKIEIVLEESKGKWSIGRKTAELLVPDNSIRADQEIISISAEQEKRTQLWLDQPIGIVTGEMNLRDPLEARIRDNPFVEFINRVQMETAAVGISNTALFTNDSPGFHEEITMRDIVSNYIYPNTLKVLRVTGQDIKDALEKSAGYFMLTGTGHLTVNPVYIEPKPQHYNYDMWEGIDYEIKVSNPIGQRLVKLDYEGCPIDMNAEFDVVMNSYRSSGGGDYEMFKGKQVVKEIQTDMTEIIADYILQRRTIHASCDHNWKVVI